MQLINDTIARYLPRLVRSYDMDAAETRETKSVPPLDSAVRRFIEKMQAVATETFKALGEGGSIAGGALVHGERAVLLAALKMERTMLASSRSGCPRRGSRSIEAVGAAPLPRPVPNRSCTRGSVTMSPCDYRSHADMRRSQSSQKRRCHGSAAGNGLCIVDRQRGIVWLNFRNSAPTLNGHRPELGITHPLPSS